METRRTPGSASSRGRIALAACALAIGCNAGFVWNANRGDGDARAAIAIAEERDPLMRRQAVHVLLRAVQPQVETLRELARDADARVAQDASVALQHLRIDR